ncbi:MAG: translation initiation factor IF-6 [Candidatus Thermoplasmatota archaeon]
MKNNKLHLQRLDFNENPNLGVFCRANDDVAFIQKGLTKKVKRRIRSTLGVESVELDIANSTIIGSLLAFNSNGAVVTSFIDKRNIDAIESNGISVDVIKDKINAAGNDILVNDYGALVHVDFKDETVKMFEEIFDVPVRKGQIASLETVGMAAVVTNQGLLCHPKVSDDEKRFLKEVFDVEVMGGTVNHGVPLIGSGVVANNKGAIVGSLTTGIEMGRIEEALGFLD